MNQDILQFIHNHALMSGLWFVLLIAIMGLEFWNKRQKAPALKPQDVINRMNSDAIEVIDIRNSTAFRQGHILNSRNLPYMGKDEQNFQSYKEKPIVLVCQQAQQSLGLANKLKQMDFKEVYVLEGGIQEWQGNDLPLVKGK